MSKGTRITIGVVMLLAAVGFLLSGIAFGHEAPAGPLGLFLMAAGCAAIGIVCLVFRRGTVFLLLFGLLLLLSLLAGDYSFFLSLLGLTVAVLGGLILLTVGANLVLQWKYRLSVEAFRMADEGDLEGAIALLREEIDRNGPNAVLYNDLSVLLWKQGDGNESLRMAERAEAVGGLRPHFLVNKGMALWKLGRTEEALSCLKKAARWQPKDLVILCNYGSLLAESGRREAAEEVLRQAEELYSDQFIFAGAAYRAARRHLLEELRQKLHPDSA